MGPVCQVCRTPVRESDFVATGMCKKHFKCGSCNRRESSFRHHGINNADFNVTPEETRIAFFKECSGLSGLRLVQYAKEALDKNKTEEQSSGHEQKWRPIKFYTDMGFKEEDVKKHGQYKNDPHWGDVYRIALDFEVDQVKSGTTRTQKLASEPAKKAVAKKTPKTPGQKRKVAVPSADTFTQWTEEQFGAWTAEVDKRADEIKKRLADVRAKPGFNEAPALISDEVQGLETAITQYATSAKVPKGELSQEFVEQLGNFAKRTRYLLSNVNSFCKAYDRMQEAKLDISILEYNIAPKFKNDVLRNLMEK